MYAMKHANHTKVEIQVGTSVQQDTLFYIYFGIS